MNFCFQSQGRLGMLAALLAVVAQSSALMAAEPVPSDRRLPPGVLLYVSSPDIPRSVNQFRQTSLGQLINDPELEDLKAKLLEKFNEISKKAEGQIDFPLSDLAALLSGEFSFAAVRPIGQSLGVVSFLDYGDHQDILDKVLTEVDSQLSEREATKETETIDGTTVTVYSIPHEGEGQSDPFQFAYFVRDHILVTGTTISLLESVLERWDGKHEATFAETPVYKEIMAKCLTDVRATPALKWYVNPIDLTMSGLSMNPEFQMASIMFTAYLPTLGLNQLKAFGGALELATEDFDSVSRTMVYVEPPATGVLKIFELRPSLQEPAAWVPDNAAQYFAFDWNVAGAYSAVESIYDAFTGQPGKFERMLNQAAGPGTGIDLHPKKDIVDALTGSFSFYMTPSKSGQPEDIEAALTIGLTDDEKGTHLLTSALEGAGNFTTKDVDGTTAYLFNDGETPGVAAVHNKQIIVANNIDRLKEVIKGQAANPLATSEKFKLVKKHLPEHVSFLSFQDASAQLQVGYDALRSGKLDNLFEGEFDFSMLPSFDVISKYIRPTAAYGIPDEHGAITVQFGMKLTE